MPDTWNFLNAMSNGAGTNPVGPIDPNTPAVLTPQQHALLKALAQHIAGGGYSPASPVPVVPSLYDQTPSAQQYSVVRHRDAPPRLPYALLNNRTGEYMPGGASIFPRLFPTVEDAIAAMPAQSRPATQPVPAAGSPAQSGGPSQEVRENSDAPAKKKYGVWNNSTGDWWRDRFGYVEGLGTHAEAKPAVEYGNPSENALESAQLVVSKQATPVPGGQQLRGKSSGSDHPGLDIIKKATTSAGVPESWATDPFTWKVLGRESGSTQKKLNSTDQNRHSSAYGAWQFLNGTWSQTGVNKTSDPLQQSVAGLRYIKQRYGSPKAAWEHEQKYGWY